MSVCPHPEPPDLRKARTPTIEVSQPQPRSGALLACTIDARKSIPRPIYQIDVNKRRLDSERHMAVFRSHSVIGGRCHPQSASGRWRFMPVVGPEPHQLYVDVGQPLLFIARRRHLQANVHYALSASSGPLSHSLPSTSAAWAGSASTTARDGVPHERGLHAAEPNSNRPAAVTPPIHIRPIIRVPILCWSPSAIHAPFGLPRQSDQPPMTSAIKPN